MRYCAAIEMSVTSASGQTSRKVVGMAITAMSRGTIAMNDAKTKARMTSAPAPATSTSTRTLTLAPASSPLASARSASNPVTLTRAPRTLAPSSADWACWASFWPGSSPPRGGI
jgi:hypothetical protein